MKKKLLCLALAAAMIMGSSLTAYAEDIKAENDWEVNFNGKDLVSNFAASNIDDAVYAILPGDSIEMSVDVKNTSDIETDWYMTNEVLQTLEEADSKGQNLPSGGAYGYLLTYTDPQGEVTTLYKSESLGGDDNEGALGLLGATESLDEYFFLDRLSQNQTGIVTLKVSLEGETQGNDYQDTLARLQMNFAVERANSLGGGEPTKSEPTPGTSTTVGFTSPKTGDGNNILIPVIALVAGLVLLVAGVIKNRREPEAETGESGRGQR